MDNIYLQTLGTYRLFVDVSNITKDIDQYLETTLKRDLEGKCQSDGFVRNDSVRILKRSLGYIAGSHFTGKITFDIVYSCDICNPVVGNIIKARVTNINKLGFLAENGPLMMLVARQYYENKEIFKDLQVNQEVMIEVIGKRFQLNDHKIEIIGKIYQENENSGSGSGSIIKTKIDQNPIEKKRNTIRNGGINNIGSASVKISNSLENNNSSKKSIENVTIASLSLKDPNGAVIPDIDESDNEIEGDEVEIVEDDEEFANDEDEY
jgi:DNA-directed RNA polymerase subunit E'/Rpb7